MRNPKKKKLNIQEILPSEFIDGQMKVTGLNREDALQLAKNSQQTNILKIIVVCFIVIAAFVVFKEIVLSFGIPPLLGFLLKIVIQKFLK